MTLDFALIGEGVSVALLFGIFWKMGRFTAWMDQAETRLKRLEDN
jgi:hypothetical protein